MRHKIKHVKQPTANTCVSACLAMLTGKPVEHVMEEFHDDYYNGWKTTVYEYLVKNGVECIPYSGGGDERVSPGNVYLATVASLNVPGSLHQIVMDLSDGKFVIHDPIKGWGDKRFYVGPDEDPEQEGAFIIHSWSVDLLIL